MSDRELPENTNGHRWSNWVFPGITLVCCDQCGRTYNPKSTKVCRPVSVELRSPTHPQLPKESAV